MRGNGQLATDHGRVPSFSAGLNVPSWFNFEQLNALSNLHRKSIFYLLTSTVSRGKVAAERGDHHVFETTTASRCPS